MTCAKIHLAVIQIGNVRVEIWSCRSFHSVTHWPLKHVSFSALLKKHVCQACSQQESRGRGHKNVHHVDKLTQSALSRSISPSPLWNPTLLMVHRSVSGEGKEKVEARRGPHHLRHWQSERAAVWWVKCYMWCMYVCLCVPKITFICRRLRDLDKC